MTTTRAALALFAVCSLMVFDTRPSAAEIIRPWCATYTGARGGATNCGFISYEQCMMTARGAGAYCAPNPLFVQGRGAYRRW